MKKICTVLFVLLAGSALCYAADPVEGYWLSIDEKTGKVTAGWQIYEDGGKLYGKILSSPDTMPDTIASKCRDTYPGFPIAGKVNQMTVIGTPWIFGLSREQAGEWTGGNVINPEDGKLYQCKLRYRAADSKKFKSDVLEMRGEIGLGIGRSQYWRKTEQTAASSLNGE